MLNAGAQILLIIECNHECNTKSQMVWTNLRVMLKDSVIFDINVEVECTIWHMLLTLKLDDII